MITLCSKYNSSFSDSPRWQRPNIGKEAFKSMLIEVIKDTSLNDPDKLIEYITSLNEQIRKISDFSNLVGTKEVIKFKEIASRANKLLLGIFDRKYDLISRSLIDAINGE